MLCFVRHSKKHCGAGQAIDNNGFLERRATIVFEKTIRQGGTIDLEGNKWNWTGIYSAGLMRLWGSGEGVR